MNSTYVCKPSVVTPSYNPVALNTHTSHVIVMAVLPDSGHLCQICRSLVFTTSHYNVNYYGCVN